jgi:small-conductance mechanosensitive channel
MHKQLGGVLFCVTLSTLALSASAEPEANGIAAPVASQSAARQGEPHGSASGSGVEQAGSVVPERSVEVRLQDNAVFSLHAGFGDQSVIDRAEAASRALLEAVGAGASDGVRVEQASGTAVVYVGQWRIVQLSLDDAHFENEASLEAYASRIAVKIKDAIVAEKRRRAVAQTVFSISLVVFLGLIALVLLKKSGELAERARAWVAANPDRVPALRIRSLQLIGAGPLNTIVIMAISMAKWLGRLVILYAYLVIATSLFEATRGFAEKLTGLVVLPISDLMARLAMTVPTLIVVAVAAIVVLLLVRFVGLFFESVENGDTELSWLPPDLAAPTSVLSRTAIVVLALVFAAPLITGDAQGSFAKLSSFVLLTLTLAVTPILANLAVGVAVVFRRQLRLGDTVEVGAYSGKLLRLGLMEMVLLDADGGEAHIPHLWQLVRPFRVTRATGELE